MRPAAVAPLPLRPRSAARRPCYSSPRCSSGPTSSICFPSAAWCGHSCAKGFRSTSPTGCRRFPRMPGAACTTTSIAISPAPSSAYGSARAWKRVSLVGCCLGGLLSVIYAALHPHDVHRLVPFALPFESRPPFPPGAAAQLVSLYGNVPAWWIRMAMNARVSNPFQLPAFLAEELGEPELAQSGGSQPTDVQCMLERWFGSDVPLAGRLFCEVMQDAFGDSQFAEGRLQVGDQRVALEHVECPVLNISAERDLRRAAARQRFIHRAGRQPRGEQPRLSKRTPRAHGQSRGARDSLAIRRDVASRRPRGSRARQHYRTSPRNPVAPVLEAPRNSR